MRRLFACAFLALAQDPPPNEILAPPAGAVFPAGPVRFIARTDGKTIPVLDGRPLNFESPHSGVLTAEIRAAPGPHELALGSQKVRFTIGGGEGEKFRAHPPTSQCTTCHAVRNGEWRFARASLVSVCSVCHSQDSFPARHTHQMGILPDCQMCHFPHGSTSAGHMKLPRETACRQCHALQ